jgi:hypothetical protein
LYLFFGEAMFRAGLRPDEDAAGLCAVSFSDLVVELPTLKLELAGLDPEQLGLLLREFLLVFDLPFDGADFLGLLAEGLARIERRDDREDGEDRGGDSGDLARRLH